MFSITDIQLAALTTHYVGNKASGETLELTKELVVIETECLANMLLQYFLAPFRETASYNLSHPSNLELNEIYHYAKSVFDDPDSLMKASVDIAKHLFEVTDLPQIKSGELHVAYFKGCPIDGVMTDALGIYKTESREQFLKINQAGRSYQFEAAEGINPDKLDKGCIIFNVQGKEGYKLHIIDRTNKGGEAQFWKDTFLKVRAADDEYHSTEDYMKLCKNFIVDQIPSEFELSRVDQIDFLNKSVEYFKNKEQFDKDEFEQMVFRQPELIDSFRGFSKKYENDYEVDFSEGFDISSAAVKKQARVFKSILKLDKNFHVYVHGNSDLIEKGYDEQLGMNYYKIFFKEEH